MMKKIKEITLKKPKENDFRMLIQFLPYPTTHGLKTRMKQLNTEQQQLISMVGFESYSIEDAAIRT